MQKTVSKNIIPSKSYEFLKIWVAIELLYNASKIWNTIRETIAKSDLSISICSLKSTLKKHIISLQKFGTFYEWDNQKTFIYS